MECLECLQQNKVFMAVNYAHDSRKIKIFIIILQLLHYWLTKYLFEDADYETQ